MFVSVRARFRMILNASLPLFFEQLPGQSRASFAASFVLRTPQYDLLLAENGSRRHQIPSPHGPTIFRRGSKESSHRTWASCSLWRRFQLISVSSRVFHRPFLRSVRRRPLRAHGESQRGLARARRALHLDFLKLGSES